MKALGDLFDERLCLVQVFVQDCSLVGHHGEQKAVSVYIERLVNEVKSILLPVVTKDVVLLVRVTELHYSSTDEVADTASDVHEGEAVV